MLRHACGFALANEGHDTRSLQAYLGHKNIQHTVRYTELSPDGSRISGGTFSRKRDRPRMNNWPAEGLPYVRPLHPAVTPSRRPPACPAGAVLRRMIGRLQMSIPSLRWPGGFIEAHLAGPKPGLRERCQRGAPLQVDRREGLWPIASARMVGRAVAVGRTDLAGQHAHEDEIDAWDIVPDRIYGCDRLRRCGGAGFIHTRAALAMPGS